MIKKLSIIMFLCIFSITVSAQEQKVSKAKEFGIGWSGLQFSRITMSNFTDNETVYNGDIKVRNIIHCGNIYFAHELNKYFYLDIQGSVGYTGKFNKPENWLYQGGIGLQFRLSPIFNSNYIDPYIRIGVGYIYKDFLINYSNINYLNTDKETSVNTNQYNKDNKEGLDKHHLFPVSAGIGVNMWMNDHWGIGLQADYLFMFHNNKWNIRYDNVANSLQGTARIMFRFGGETKKTYRDVYVDKIVEKYTEVVRVDTVKVTIHVKEKVSDLISNIHFEFDSDILTENSQILLDDLANIMQDNADRKYLIVGSTDAKGSVEYNQNLSLRRAMQVVKGLKERGVPAEILKARGIGKQAAAAGSKASNDIREGDRKVTVEIINNVYYWNYIK